MNRKLRIWSYFSITPDLAAEMRDWPEFVTGTGYDVDVCSSTTEEAVAVRYVERREDAHVIITSTGSGSLFDRITGRVIYAMSAHTDYLMIDRHVAGD